MTDALLREPTLDIPGPGIPGLVSVVIPTYNRAATVVRAITSVLEQTYTNVEVLVADDGSTDDTKARVSALDPRVRYLHQQNAGVSAARNLGLRNVRGEFVALLDSDDAWLPWKLELQVAALRALPSAGMVWSDMTAVDASGGVVHQRYLRRMYTAYERVELERVLEYVGMVGDISSVTPVEWRDGKVFSGEMFSQIFLGNLVHTSTVVLRRTRLALVGGFNEGLRKTGEDYEFHLRTCSYGPVAFVDVPTTLYRIGAEDQLSAPHLLWQIARNDLRTVLMWRERAGDRLQLPESVVRQRVHDSMTWVGEAELASGRRLAAAWHLARSLPNKQGFGRHLMLLVMCLMPKGAISRARAIRGAIREGGRGSGSRSSKRSKVPR